VARIAPRKLGCVLVPTGICPRPFPYRVPMRRGGQPRSFGPENPAPSTAFNQPMPVRPGEGWRCSSGQEVAVPRQAYRGLP
jgi:hypothetical protein